MDAEAAHADPRKANRISIRHEYGTVVAIIEVVSPGNKDSRHALGSFVSKAVDFLRNGIHLLLIDLLPPTPATRPGSIRPSGNALPTIRSSCGRWTSPRRWPATTPGTG